MSATDLALDDDDDDDDEDGDDATSSSLGSYIRCTQVTLIFWIRESSEFDLENLK